MTNEKIRFAQRLIEAMQAQGYDPEPAILEREFNLRYFGKPMTLQGVRKWLIGTSIPSTDKIMTLAKWLKIPPDELTFGKEIKMEIEEANQHWQHEIGFNEREIFEAFINLPTPQKKIVREVIVAFAKAYTTHQK
ncbi:XRE family transcriptional regulator [Acinetobacter sp. VNH17]|uniref:XRE family transcriptional regulator n=1 Tax=Acinetobacter thutiue TaxID=2998078 RepID=A0ABT7WRP6_9GAMM|nr:XRE family transcriptional regulator [Acinetobacter thutiue]MCY6413239.1 XRE family transcriptional regulator [Acinetobacter thutiue]MDN0015348.1 XRE family transcriptional regulator [Acinetobacter thutiue]